MPRFGSSGELGEPADLCQQQVNGVVVIGKFATLAFDLAGEFFHPQCQLRVGGHGRAHPDEGADDQDADFQCPTRAKDIGKHQTAMLRKDPRQSVEPSCALQYCRILRQHPLPLCQSQLKGKATR